MNSKTSDPSVMPDYGGADAGPTSAFEVIADHFGLKKKAALSKPAVAANASAEVRLREDVSKDIYYLESIQRQLTEYRDFVGSCEVLAPSIGGEVLADNLDWLDCYIVGLKRNEAPSDGAIYAAVSKSQMSAEDRAALEAHIDRALSAHPHASDCFASVTVPASGIAKLMDAIENPPQPNEALKKLMRDHASDCDKQGSAEAPRVTDNDSDEITVSLDGKELRGWSYSSDQERRVKMLCAREFVEGFCDGRSS